MLFSDHYSLTGLAILLRRRSRLCLSLFSVTFIESVNATRRVYQLLFAGKKRMAGGTDFNVQVSLAGGASLKTLAASASDRNLVILRVNSWLHF